MEFITNLIATQWISIVVVIIVIIVGLYLLRNGQKDVVYQMLFYLVLEAEKAFGGGTGELKYSAVTTWLYERLPTIIRILFTSKQIDAMIEKAVLDMKEYLGKNSQARVLILDN